MAVDIAVLRTAAWALAVFEAGHCSLARNPAVDTVEGYMTAQDIHLGDTLAARAARDTVALDTAGILVALEHNPDIAPLVEDTLVG